MKSILSNIGALYATADEDDMWHDRICTFLETGRHQLVVPVTVLPEICYLIGTY